MFSPNLHACIALAEHALSQHVMTTISMESGQFSIESRQHYFRCSETRTVDVEISLKNDCKTLRVLIEKPLSY